MNSITDEQKFFENYKKRITRDIIKTLYKNYKIYNSENVLIDIETLQQEILTPKNIKRCVGTTNTTPISQCTRNTLDNYNYCKTHLYKICLQSQLQENNCQTSPINFITPTEIKYTKNKNNLKKKFIEDSFYFIDDKFIYDTDYIKVGYIQHNDFVLTSDPFVLETL